MANIARIKNQTLELLGFNDWNERPPIPNNIDAEIVEINQMIPNGGIDFSKMILKAGDILFDDYGNYLSGSGFLIDRNGINGADGSSLTFKVYNNGFVKAANLELFPGGKITIANGIIDVNGGQLWLSPTNYLEWVGAPSNYWDFNAGSVHTWGDYYADGNIVADYENNGTGKFQVGTDDGKTLDYTVSVGDVLHFKGGILIGVN